MESDSSSSYSDIDDEAYTTPDEQFDEEKPTTLSPNTERKLKLQSISVQTDYHETQSNQIVSILPMFLCNQS